MIDPAIDIYSLLHTMGCFVGEGLIKSTLLLIPVIVIHAAVQKRYPLACTAVWHACLGGLFLLASWNVLSPVVGSGYFDQINRGTSTVSGDVRHEHSQRTAFAASARDFAGVRRHTFNRRQRGRGKYPIFVD